MPYKTPFTPAPNPTENCSRAACVKDGHYPPGERIQVVGLLLRTHGILFRRWLWPLSARHVPRSAMVPDSCLNIEQRASQFETALGSTFNRCKGRVLVMGWERGVAVGRDGLTHCCYGARHRILGALPAAPPPWHRVCCRGEQPPAEVRAPKGLQFLGRDPNHPPRHPNSPIQPTHATAFADSPGKAISHQV